MTTIFKYPSPPRSPRFRSSKPPSQPITIHQDPDCLLDPQYHLDALFHRKHGFRRQELAAFHISGIHKALASYDLTHGHWCLNNPLPRKMNQAFSYNWDYDQRGENWVPQDAREEGWVVGYWVSRLEEYERDGEFDWRRYRRDGVVGGESEGEEESGEEQEEEDLGEENFEEEEEGDEDESGDREDEEEEEEDDEEEDDGYDGDKEDEEINDDEEEEDDGDDGEDEESLSAKIVRWLMEMFEDLEITSSPCLSYQRIL